MRNINYLIVHKDHPFDRKGVNSGAENATRALAQALCAGGYQVVVAAQLSGSEHKAENSASGVSLNPDQNKSAVEWWDLGEAFDTQAALQRMHERGRYCLISAGRAQVILESRNDQRCVARILISHDRSGNDTGIRPEVLCRVADRVVCVSNAQREIFLKAGAPPEKVVTLFNGVDLDLFPVGQPAERDFQKLVFVGALVEDKGIHWLIESFCALKPKYPQLTLDVYGTSGLWGRAPLFNEKEIEQKVPGIKFHGKVSQEIVGKAMSTAGLCVIPSIWFDPFPLTALEAQATGCPVLTFDVGGLKEGVRDQETALVMKEITPQALTGSLDLLLSNPERLKEFSTQALKLCRPRFTWERVASDLLAQVEAVQQSRQSPLVRGQIGVVSTWNQSCGLATYAKYLFSQFPAETTVVFSESVPPASMDDARVVRCWNKGSADLGKLEQAIVSSGVVLVHLNVHPEFFAGEVLSTLVRKLRERGVKVVAHLHNTFTYQPALAALVGAVDRVIVHAPENRAQLVANGAIPENVEVVPHGVQVQSAITPEERTTIRQKIGVSSQAVLISSFGFIQPHKGMEGVIEGVAHLVQRGVDARGALVGQVMASDPYSQGYAARLKELATTKGVQDRITFFDKFVPEAEVTEYLQASDIVLMNYGSSHYEASGACAVAVGSGALVVTSLAPPFQPFGEAVWHLTSGFPLTLSLELLLTNQPLRTHIQASARAYAEQYSWPRTAQTILDIYARMSVEPTANDNFDPSSRRMEMEWNKQAPSIARPMALKILMQPRPNALSQRGGDTVVLEKTAIELRSLGHQVEIDVEGRCRPEDFDVVHLFNFALPDLLKAQAERCVQAKTPFVVTTLCEDVPSFHNQSWEAARILVEYVSRGQNSEWLRSQWGRLSAVVPSTRFNNDWVAAHADALIANGDGETQVLRRDYPSAKSILEVPVGFDLGADGSAATFVREHGVSDFVLCVGRIESRKNQLMLLQALEHSDIPVVLVGGGFSYQPEYEQAVRKFKRKGKTIILGRLSPEMLSSAYAACRVHALPSWYELPGLVSLEAAAYGKNIVVSATGTTPNYFAELAMYASPSDPRSIKNAVLAAFYAPVDLGLSAHVQQYRWKSAAEATANVYQKVLQSVGRTPRLAATSVRIETPTVAYAARVESPAAPMQNSVPAVGSSIASAIIDGNKPNAEVAQLLEAGENAARAGDFVKARQLLGEVEQRSPGSAQCLRSLGAVALAEEHRPEAKRYFERALAIDPRETKSIVGLGMCAALDGEYRSAQGLLIKALSIDDTQTTALHQLIQCANVLGDFAPLEQALRQYLKRCPDDNEFQFCLAGCVYKQGNFEEASRIVDAVLARDSSHRGAGELRTELRSRASRAATPVVAPVGSSVGSVPQHTTNVATSEASMPAEPSWLQALKATPFAVPAQKDPTKSSTSVQNAQPSVSTGAPASNGSQKWETTASQPSEPRVVAPSLNGGTPEQVLAHIEELKRGNQLAEAGQACDEFLARGLAGEFLEQARLLRAEVHCIREEIEQARRLFDSVLGTNPRSARALCGKGALAAHAGNWGEAEALFQKAQMLSPSYDVACAGLGLCAFQREESQQAWHWYWRATQANPECLRALLGLVELAYPLKKLAELEQALRQYLDLHPADLQFVYSLAGCLYAQNKMPEAKCEIEKIIIFEPAHERAVELKGIIEQRMGQSGGGGHSH